MKQTFCSIILLLIFIPCNLYSQPDWKYHLAFKDNTGAKDTLWFVYDDDATFYGTDLQLGEVPVSLNLGEFNVFMYNVSQSGPDLDTFKLIAHPWEYVFEFYIYAFNFELPIKISWDTTILHSSTIPPEPVGWMNYARLDNDYFFLYPNLPFAHQFDMTIADGVLAPDPDEPDPFFWISGVHFPMVVYLSQNPTLKIPEINPNQVKLTAFPIPASMGKIFIRIQNQDKSNKSELKCFNLMGEEVYQEKLNPLQVESVIDLGDWQQGIYLAVLYTQGKVIGRVKFVVSKQH